MKLSAHTCDIVIRRVVRGGGEVLGERGKWMMVGGEVRV
jgi:hypothetical protein